MRNTAVWIFVATVLCISLTDARADPRSSDVGLLEETYEAAFPHRRDKRAANVTAVSYGTMTAMNVITEDSVDKKMETLGVPENFRNYTKHRIFSLATSRFAKWSVRTIFSTSLGYSLYIAVPNLYRFYFAASPDQGPGYEPIFNVRSDGMGILKAAQTRPETEAPTAGSSQGG